MINKDAEIIGVGTESAPDLAETEDPQRLFVKAESYRFRSSLSQWRAFHAVIAFGGYAGAAESLNVTQPAISYSISKLENQFGIRLLRLNGRKAYLTHIGRKLLVRSHELLQMADELEIMAASLRNDTRASSADFGDREHDCNAAR